MSPRRWKVVHALAAALTAAALFVGLAFGGGSFADDMNHACAHHGGVFWFDAQQGSGTCRDGKAVAP